MTTQPTELLLLADHLASIGIPSQLHPAGDSQPSTPWLSVTLPAAFDGKDVIINAFIIEPLANAAAEEDDEDEAPLSIVRLLTMLPMDWSHASLSVMVGLLEQLNPLLPFGAFTLHPEEYQISLAYTHAVAASAFDTNPLVRVIDTWAYHLALAARPFRLANTGTPTLQEILEDFSVILRESMKDEEG